MNDNSGIQITWLQTTMLQLVLNNKNTPQIKKSEFKAKNQKGKKPRKKDRIFILALVFFFLRWNGAAQPCATTSWQTWLLTMLLASGNEGLSEFGLLCLAGHSNA